MDSILDDIRKDIEKDNLIYSNHAAVRLVENNLRRRERNSIILLGEEIETYYDDYPCPSLLVLGFIREIPIHIVVAKCHITSVIITLYFPDPQNWIDLRRRNE